MGALLRFSLPLSPSLYLSLHLSPFLYLSLSLLFGPTPRAISIPHLQRESQLESSSESNSANYRVLKLQFIEPFWPRRARQRQAEKEREKGARGSGRGRGGYQLTVDWRHLTGFLCVPPDPISCGRQLQYLLLLLSSFLSSLSLPCPALL